MTMDRVHLTFTPQRDSDNHIVLYTVVGNSLECPLPPIFPERSFTTFEAMERTMSPMIAPEVMEKIRLALASETKFVFEISADQASALRLFSEQGK